MTAYMDHKNLANEAIDGVRAVQIADGVHRVLDRIASAEQHAGRDAGSVRLLAATKTRDVGEIMAAIDAGVRESSAGSDGEGRRIDGTLRGARIRVGRCRRCRRFHYCG